MRQHGPAFSLALQSRPVTLNVIGQITTGHAHTMKRERLSASWRFLHGTGHRFYLSKKAKELYGRQLVSLSEKLFLFMFAPFFGFFLDIEEVNLLAIILGALSLALGGLYLRHQGLLIIDQVKTKEIQIELPPGTDR